MDAVKQVEAIGTLMTDYLKAHQPRDVSIAITFVKKYAYFTASLIMNNVPTLATTELKFMTMDRLEDLEFIDDVAAELAVVAIHNVEMQAEIKRLSAQVPIILPKGNGRY